MAESSLAADQLRVICVLVASATTFADTVGGVVSEMVVGDPTKP
jgi:hypothetical protein